MHERAAGESPLEPAVAAALHPPLPPLARKPPSVEAKSRAPEAKAAELELLLKAAQGASKAATAHCLTDPPPPPSFGTKTAKAVQPPAGKARKAKRTKAPKAAKAAIVKAGTIKGPYETVALRVEPKEDALENLQWIDKEKDLAVSIERKSIVKVLDKKGEFVEIEGETDGKTVKGWLKTKYITVHRAPKKKEKKKEEEEEEEEEEEGDDDDEYTVEYISEHKGEGKKRLYLVHWEGYDETTWEPASNLENNVALDEYIASLKK